MTRRRAGAALFVLGVVTLLLTAEVPTPERAAILNPLTGQPTSDTPLQRSLWLALGAALEDTRNCETLCVSKDSN